MSSAAIPPALGASAACVMKAFGAQPFRTDGDVFALAFAENGILWSLEDQGVLRQWNVGAQQETRFAALDDPSSLWAFSPAAGLVAAGSDELQVWDAALGEGVAGWVTPSWVGALAFSPDGKILATGHDDGIVRIWSPDSQKFLREFRAHGKPVSALAFDASGKKLATSGEDKAIHLWDLRTDKPIGSLLGHTDRISALAWHPDGKRFLSAGWDTTARVWDLKTCEPIILLNAHTGQVFTFAMSPDGALLACADSGNAIQIWDLAKYKILHTLRGHASEVRTMAWAADSQRLAAGGADRIIHIWDARQGSLSEQPVDPQASRTCLAVRDNGNRILSLGAGTALRVWDQESGNVVLQLEKAGALRAFAVSADGGFIAGARAMPDEPEVWHAHPTRRKDPPADFLGIWNGKTGQLLRFLDGAKPPVTSLAFSPDGKKLATGGFLGDDVWLWDVADGEPILLVPEASGGSSVEAIAWHPQGKFLAATGIDYMATGGNDGKTGIWNVEGRHPIAWIAGGGTALAYHPRGHHLAIASLVQTVRVWDVSSKEPAHAVELIGHLDAVTCLAYSPDGAWLATGSDDHSVRIWDSATGLQKGQVDLDTQVKALAFGPDGRSLFTGNGNTSCYQLDVRKLLAEGL